MVMADGFHRFRQITNEQAPHGAFLFGRYSLPFALYHSHNLLTELS